MTPALSLTITPIYAALLGLMLVALSAHVIRQRFRARVSVGDGGDHGLYKAIRVQANFAEYAPMAVIVLAMAEILGAPGWVVHALGAMLVLGRALHAWGYGSTPQVVWARQAGMALTFAMLTLAALATLAHALI